MADKKEKEKKGLLGKLVDAVSQRDDKEEAAAAEAAAKAKAAADAKAKADAAIEETRRRIAENQAAAKAKAEAEAKLKEAEEKVAKMEAEKKAAAFAAELKRKEEEAEKRLEEFKAKQAAEAAAAEAAKPRVYVVQGGDSLSKIAKEQLGNAARWPEIFEMNKDKIANPNLIRVGQELTLPKE